MGRRKPKYNKELNAAILEVVENQLREKDPPETQETYDRLRKTGFSDKEARDLIACVVICELSDMVKTQEPFDRDRYVSALRRLPTLPWE